MQTVCFTMGYFCIAHVYVEQQGDSTALWVMVSGLYLCMLHVLCWPQKCGFWIDILNHGNPTDDCTKRSQPQNSAAGNSKQITDWMRGFVYW
jgi:hypothetical protein